MEKIEYKIWFSKLNLENKSKLMLLNDFGNCKKIFECTEDELKEKYYTFKIINKILDAQKNIDVKKDLEFIEKEKIKIINCYDSEYPGSLKVISNKPVQIYVIGNYKKLYEPNIAIIGSRNASKDGLKIAKNVANKISQKGINVVSGLAIGIDKYAHLGAINSGIGNTIAVLGNGLSKSVLYPLENYKLYEKIIENNGCIVSEYPCFEKAQRYMFPERNRIISGLSEKILVVEAGPKSGSLITVEYALEQGKDVYAVPRKYSKIFIIWE